MVGWAVEECLDGYEGDGRKWSKSLWEKVVEGLKGSWEKVVEGHGVKS